MYLQMCGSRKCSKPGTGGGGNSGGVKDLGNFGGRRELVDPIFRWQHGI